jgi:hypothetical protein
MIINMIYVYWRPVYGGAVPDAVLCKTYNVLCVPEKPRAYGLIKRVMTTVGNCWLGVKQQSLTQTHLQ